MEIVDCRNSGRIYKIAVVPAAGFNSPVRRTTGGKFLRVSMTLIQLEWQGDIRFDFFHQLSELLLYADQGFFGIGLKANH